MSLQCGIVGLPNVGKSTLFNSLSSAEAEAANFPFCTIDPNVGVVNVPDPRLYKLAELVDPQQVIPAVVEFVDIAGLVKGASKNEGLGNKFLANIRETDAIVHVVRCFEDDNIAHVAGNVDPVFDKEVIDSELIFKDLETIENRIAKTQKVAKSGDKEAKVLLALLERIKAQLEETKPARSMEFSDEELLLVKDLQLLTTKPVIYVANVDEESLQEGNTYEQALIESVQEEGAQVIRISAAIEAQIAELEDDEERKVFLEEYGLEESGMNRLIRTAYQTLNLITYFTAGPKEVKAWTIRRGWKAPQAAGVIHSDFEKGFIRAEVIPYETYLHYGSENAVKEAGKMALEGKDYVVQDGDVMHFRFNV